MKKEATLHYKYLHFWGLRWFASGTCRERDTFSFWIPPCWYLNTETFISRLSCVGLRLFCIGVALVLRSGDQLYYTFNRVCILGT